MPDSYEREDSPYIRVARNGSVTRFAEAEGSATAAVPRYGAREPFVDLPAGPIASEEYPSPGMRERPMPKRLSEEAREAAEAQYRAQVAPAEVPSQTPPTKRKSSKRKKSTAAVEEADQIALPLKAPKPKPDTMVRQRQVLGFCCIILAVLVLLAIISYSSDDASRAETKITDLPALFLPHGATPDPIRDAVRASADQARNWLGLIGAMLANFLINKTIGFAAILYPIFFGAWSFAFFRFSYKQRKRLTLATTFFLITGILFSATMGTVATFANIPREWSGSVGQFLGLAFSRAIGGAGAFILYASAFIVMLIFSIDLDIEKTFIRLHHWWTVVVMWTRKQIIAFWERREARQAEKAALRAAEEEEAAAQIEDIPSGIEQHEQESTTDLEVPLKQEKIGMVSKEIPATIPALGEVAPAAKKPVPMASAKFEPLLLDPAPAAISSETPKPNIPNPAPETRLTELTPAPILTASAPLPGQPLLKVRPAKKHEVPASIPRLTRNGHDQLGSRSMHFSRFTNGALEEEADKKESPASISVPKLSSAQTYGPETLLTANSTSTATALVEATGSDLTSIETPPDDVPVTFVRDDIANIDTSEELIDPLRPRAKPLKPDPDAVQVGDAKVLANEALPHSVSEESALPIPKLREVEHPSSEEPGTEDLFFEEGEKPVVPENPYLEILSKYRNPSVELLTPADPKDALDADDEELAKKGRLLRDKLATFGVDIENITVTPGPVVTLYEFTPAEGIKVSRVENLTDDIALAMKARGIRIIAPIPGRGTIGVEIPNDVAKMVRIRSLFESESFRKTKMNLPLALGKTISGDVYVDDLNKMPHLLIAGATGSGKSVGVNGIIASLLYAKSPRDIKFVIVDPKKIELSLYKKLRKHYLIVSPEAGEDIVTTPAYAVLALKAVELEMERRYDKLAKAAVRSLADYNIKVAQGKLRSTQDEQHYHLPYIVVIIDELADLMITAAKEIEEPICRIAQMARAVGIHMILATQRPSVDVLTGVIKANFPARIAYQVATRVDSRTILDVMGAEQLMGNGDMLYLPSGTPKAIRLQSPFISTDEVEAIVDAIASQDGDKLSYSRPWTLPSLRTDDDDDEPAFDDADDRDELFEEAAKVLVRHQQGSVSLLQRRLKIGYSRAARVMDELEAAGIVGPFDGAKARPVMCETEAELEVVLEGLR